MTMKRTGDKIAGATKAYKSSAMIWKSVWHIESTAILALVAGFALLVLIYSLRYERL